MDAQLVPIAEVALGMVTSTLLRGERLTANEEIPPSETLISLCPTGRLLAFITASYQAQFQFMEDGPLQHVHRDSDEVVSYRNSFEGLLDVPREPDNPKPRPQATAALVVPIAFQTQSGSVQRSSIVMVGFSDGYIRGYSKSGQRVFSRLMHLEPVTKLTCMASSNVAKPSPAVNNLVVLYRSCTVCVVEGWSLVEVIKANVTEMTRGGEGVGAKGEEGTGGEGDGGVNMLKYKKWNVKDQSLTNDVALLAHTTPSLFDHLCEASNVAGFDATIRSTPIPEAKLITVGENPMIALYKVTKDAGHINMSEVMQVMASKMTNAVLGRLSKAGGWLGWGGGGSAQKQKPPEEKIEISTNLPMSANIPDSRRSVLSVTVSPLGNLAAAVDGFGRVLLLDCESLVIRRMWKGYRDAQCGWMLVYDTISTSDGTSDHRKFPKSSKRHSSSSSRSGRGSSSYQSEDLAVKKKAQCLCIYAPRRGILELWPVQSGSRVAAIPIGKGCRLLYAPHSPFMTVPSPSASSSSSSSEATGRSPQREQLLLKEQDNKLPRVRDHILILFPDGKISTLTVPFPALVRLADPASFDTHLMKKLPLAIQSGDTDMILQVVQCVKSSQSLKKAIDVIIDAHPVQSISTELLLELLNTALSRLTSHLDDATLLSLFQYISGVKQLFQFVFGIQSLSSVQSSSHFTANKLQQSLSELCGLSSQLAKSSADILFSYFTSFSPQRRVVMVMDLKTVVKCFKLPSKIGNVLIGSSSSSSGCYDDGKGVEVQVQRSISEPESEVGVGQSDSVVELYLKETLSSSTLLDLGCTLFLPLLTHTPPSADIAALFSYSGLQPNISLSLLSRALLNGSLMETNPCALLQRLSAIFSAVLHHPQLPLPVASLRNDLLFHCGHTHCAGHALLLALLSQKCVNVSSAPTAPKPHPKEEEAMEVEGEWEELETWEPVSAEKEEWIRLIHHLEGLTLLSNAVGQGNMRKLPPAPWTDAQQQLQLLDEWDEGEEEESCAEREKRRLDLGNLRIMFLSDVMKGGVTAAALESYGPTLFAHSITKWFTENKIPAEFIAQMPSDPHDLPDGEYSKVVYQFGQLLRLFPRSLSHQSLLIHSAWQAAHDKKYQLALDFVSQLGNLNYLRGTVGFLWHFAFESEIVRSIDAIRKGVTVDSTTSDVISISRNLFSYLYEISLFDEEAVSAMSSTGRQLKEKDVLVMSRKPGKLSLLEMIDTFPHLSPKIVRTYFELMLLTEVVLQLKRPINVVSFFPTWLRSALKKGAFKSAWQEQVPVQLQQRRTKFLCECVRGVLREPASSIKMSSTRTSVALKNLRMAAPSVSLAHLELADLEDFVFLLCDLWGVASETVKVYWLSNLFAAGKEATGKKIFLTIDDKTKVSRELLSLAGFLCDHMIKTTENKMEELALLAQTPPTLLQWLKKQTSSGISRSCDLVAPTWRCLSVLVTLIQPYLVDMPNASSTCKELETLINITQKV